MLRLLRFRRHGISNNHRRGGFGSAPSYTPPPAPPPAASPATLASASVAAKAVGQQNNMRGQAGLFGTAGGAEGVAPSSVTTAKANLLGGIS